MRYLMLCLGLCLNPFLSYADDITLQLKWKHAFQFAGYYMALEKGYYAKEGLNVTLIEGEPGQNAAQYTLDHQGAYAVTDTGALLAYAAGKPIKALGAIFQHSALALMVLEDSGIKTIADLRGKKIMLQAGYQGADILAALKRGAGMTPRDFILQKSSFDVHDLIVGKTDAFSIYVTNQPYKLDIKSIPYRIFYPNDQGVDFYGDILITSEHETEIYPERANAFMRATIQGWIYALDHTDEVIDLMMLKYNKRHHSRDIFMFEAQETIKLIRQDMVQIGSMNMHRWQHIAQVYAELGLIAEDHPVDGFIHQRSLSLLEIIISKPWQFVVAVLLLIVLVSGLNIVILRRQVQLRMDKLVESQQDFRHLIELADIGIIVYRGGRLLFANPYVLKRLRVASLDEVRGKEILQFIHPDDHADVQQRAIEVMQHGASFHGLSVRYVNAAEECFDIEASSIPIHYEGELAVLTVALDLTESKRAAKAKASMERKVEQTQRLESLGVLAGGVAHNFNNLLAVILGHASMAIHKVEDHAAVKDSGVEEHLTPIIEASESAALLCKQMLAYSGQGQFIVAWVDLAHLLEEMKEILEVSVGDNIIIDYQVDANASLIHIDAAQMQQVILNLVSNASDAIQEHGQNRGENREKNGEKITIRTGMMDVDDHGLKRCVAKDVSAGRFVYLEVSDSGCGIDVETIGKMFEPFFSTKFTGRGLGMSAMLGIVGAYHGAIKIDSTVGEGSCIRVLFPTKDNNTDPDNT